MHINSQYEYLYVIFLLKHCDYIKIIVFLRIIMGGGNTESMTEEKWKKN